jgi:hypothetical protein
LAESRQSPPSERRSVPPNSSERSGMTEEKQPQLVGAGGRKAGA